MKISQLTNCPDWLRDARTENADVDVFTDGWVTWKSGDFMGGDFMGGDFMGGDFIGGDFIGGDFMGGDFIGGTIKGSKALKIRAHVGLYAYQVSAALLADGTRWVQMGCLWKSLDEWDKIGIRNSNLDEFPNDGSEKCEERVAAFEFAKAAALRMKADVPQQEETQ